MLLKVMKWIKERFPLLIVFTGLVCIYLILVWGNQSHNHNNAAKENTPMEETISGGSVGESIERVTSNNDVRENQNKSQEETRLEKSERLQVFDYYAQIAMAIAAWAGIGLGLVGTILLFFTLRYTRDAASAASDTLTQATIATKAAVISLNNDRAWMAVNNTPHSVVDEFTAVLPNGKTEVTKNGITFSITIKNVGRTPAKNVRASMDFKILPKSDSIPEFETTIAATQRASFIAPNGVHTRGRLDIIGNDARKIWAKTHVAYIFLKCEYETVFDDAVRYTRETFEFYPEGNHVINGKRIPKFNISQVGKQNINT